MDELLFLGFLKPSLLTIRRKCTLAGLSSGGDDCVWTIHLSYFYKNTNLKNDMHILKSSSTNLSHLFIEHCA